MTNTVKETEPQPDRSASVAGQGGPAAKLALGGEALGTERVGQDEPDVGRFSEKPEDCSSQRTDEKPGLQRLNDRSRDRENANAWFLLPLWDMEAGWEQVSFREFHSSSALGPWESFSSWALFNPVCASRT